MAMPAEFRRRRCLRCPVATALPAAAVSLAEGALGRRHRRTRGGRVATLATAAMGLLARPAGSYEVYVDEYANPGKLPGHKGDQRGLPNLPFTVDTNRQSDGISTVSPLTMTSPSLPYYTESAFFDEFGVTSVENRRTHFHLTQLSQEEQGIAERGAGDAARENAAYKRVMRGNLEYFPNATFGVHADTRWNPSAFAIQAEETYQVEVRGAQDWIDGLIRTDADGYDAHYDAVSRCHVAAGRCRSYLKQPLRLKEGRWFQLICGVGNYVWKLQEAAAEADRFLRLMEDEFSDSVFAVGGNHTFRATHTGELVCFANDANGLYFNNAGALNVTVTRLSWPPLALNSNGTYDLKYVSPTCTRGGEGGSLCI
uniref:Uncharacterized protein n=1 Tax=Florenciella parvula TaxID=236787 RepID=A0A7S2D7Z9_9STRA|mmetsp:Transcript_9474/g.20048  ORF Transcript_9474/g.20048 Transcript_9474/m.20048 type:complete len:369 (+) Transcript_9474:111-1217(+)